jgi:hypothetical protein
MIYKQISIHAVTSHLSDPFLAIKTIVSVDATPDEKQASFDALYAILLKNRSSSKAKISPDVLLQLNTSETIESLIDSFEALELKYNEYFSLCYPNKIRAADVIAETLNKISGVNSATLTLLRDHKRMGPIITHIRYLHHLDDWC